MALWLQSHTFWSLHRSDQISASQIRAGFDRFAVYFLLPFIGAFCTPRYLIENLIQSLLLFISSILVFSSLIFFPNAVLKIANDSTFIEGVDCPYPQLQPLSVSFFEYH